MQLFPVADTFGQPSSSSAMGFSSEDTYSYAPMHNGESSFKDIFAKVSAYNDANTPGVPVTMRSSKDDNSYLQSDDFKFLKEKLTELGVDAAAIDKFFSKLSKQANHPSVGTLASTLTGMGKSARSTEDLTDQEMIAFRSLAGKLGFSQDELTELEEKMSSGDTLFVLQAFQKKLEGQDLKLSKDELGLLCRAADLDGTQLAPILAYWEQIATDDQIIFSKENFDKMFGNNIAELKLANQQTEILADNLGSAILAMLENKQNTANAPVASKRGSALTERTETMARILATLISEEESKNKESSGTSHLIDDKDAGKITHKQSTVAAILDKSNKEVARDLQEDALSGQKEPSETADANAKSGVFGAAANAGKNSAQPSPAAQTAAAQENALRNGSASAFGNMGNSGEENLGDNTKKDDKAQQNLLGSARQNGDANMSADKAALNAKVQEASGVVFGMFGNTENSSQSGQVSQAAKSGIYDERIFEKLERGIIKNASDGSKQIVIRLDPPELGKLTLSLSMAQGEIKAVIRTESSATTQVVSEQLAQLKQSLEEQGFKVSSLEVETRTQSHAGTDHWSGASQHNQEREQTEQQRFLRLSRTRAKEADTLAQSMQYIDQPASISASGIHIVA